jgi:predicted HicB family RNase H-like nuclease
LNLLKTRFANNPVGRPSLGPEQKRNNKVVVCLRNNEKEALKEMAKVDGTSVSNVIRKLIIERYSMEQLVLYLPPEQKTTLSHLAKQQRTSVTRLVQSWLAAQIKHIS